MTFISRNFDFRIIGEFLNSRASIHLTEKPSETGVFNISKNFEFGRHQIREY